MNEKILSLIVPDEKETRLDIRNKVESFFGIKDLMPPVSYETLFEYAGSLIKTYQWDEKYRAFIMVCCGNSIWRSVVGTIPFNRRILLLPQCLRNSTYCKAEQDTFGLLCHECGNCSISRFTHEAEELGYVTLVTEGSTITSKLIESGNVDAFIGVGCMESLQKMFVSISKYSIPGIGIPLLTCGCKDTLADFDWIKQEIYHFHENSNMRLLNLNDLRKKISSIFEEEQLKQVLEKSKNITEKIALNSLLSGGQRLRPLLAILTYEAFCKQPDPKILAGLALSVECFHKASLIHDDIEDNDDLRYGKETIHARYGIPVAINTGDFLIGEGYRLIAESELPSELICHSLKIVAQGHKSLTIGQGTELIAVRNGEILSLNELLCIFENKTAAAFRISLLLGAAMGEADEATLKILDEFSHYIGIAYQIKDDLSDYQGSKGDIEVRNFSILLSLLLEKVTPEEKDKLLSVADINGSKMMFEFINRYQIEEETITLLKEYIRNAKNVLEDFRNIGLKIALHEILGKTFKDYI